MSNDDQTPGWAAPDEPGTFIPPSWQAPAPAMQPDDELPAPAPGAAAVLYPSGPVGGGSSSTYIASQAATTAPKKKRGCLRKILIAIAILIALMSAGVFWLFKATAGAEKEAHAFVNEIVAGDADAAYARTAGSFRETYSKLDFTTGVEAKRAALDGATVSSLGRFISSKSGCASRAVITYRLRTSSSTSYARIVLKKVDGTWKVAKSTLTDSEPTTDLASDEEC